MTVTAARKDIPLPALQRLLGHDRPTTTEIYLNLRPTARSGATVMDPNSPFATVLSFLGGLPPLAIVLWWRDCRRQRRWQQEDAEQQRQWALREQLREMEQQIREEHMPEEEREWHWQYRDRQAEIKREARRRLGLPAEDSAER